MAFLKGIVSVFLLSIVTYGEGDNEIKLLKSYKRAYDFQKLHEKVYNQQINFHSIDGKRFWYCLVGPKSYFRYKLVTVDESVEVAKVEDLFDHVKFTESLSKTVKASLKPFHVNVSKMRITDDGFDFKFDNKWWSFNKSDYSFSPTKKNENKSRTGNHTASKYSEYVFRKKYNLFLKSDSGNDIQLTSDGTKSSPYGVTLNSPVSNGNYSIKNGGDSGWTDDSGRYQISWKMDISEVPKYSYINSANGKNRPKVLEGTYCFAGDEGLPSSQLYLIDKKKRAVKTLNIPVQPQLYYGNPGFLQFDSFNKRFLIFHYERGFKKFTLFEVMVTDGTVREIFSEEHENGVNLYHFYWKLINEGKELLFFSERDGWRHIYRFDAISGKLLNQVTKGKWIVRKVEKVDEKKREILFYASGATEEVNPYLSQLCRVKFDGTGFKVLTPEPYHHRCGFSGDYIIDSYSSTNHPPTSVLRRSSDGKVLAKLADADCSELDKLNILRPETFVAKGEDGLTDIYGVVWRPSNFDSTKKYPVIEYIYSGPHTDFADFSFNSFCWENQMLAELGFITVVINGKGTEGRGREFRDVCYKNLGRAGLPDHVSWLKSLSDKYSYIDIDRVGIYGHSAGGYDSSRALLAYPEFYKVGVSSAGVHDFRLDKASWVEQWMGYPAGKWYDEQSNVNNAHKLKGQLLLMHGELDDNVPVASTLRFARALQKHHKIFDMMIFPEQKHGLYGKTFIKKRMDFFVRYLHGQNPPLNVK